MEEGDGDAEDGDMDAAYRDGDARDSDGDADDVYRDVRRGWGRICGGDGRRMPDRMI